VAIPCAETVAASTSVAAAAAAAAMSFLLLTDMMSSDPCLRDGAERMPDERCALSHPQRLVPSGSPRLEAMARPVDSRAPHRRVGPGVAATQDVCSQRRPRGVETEAAGHVDPFHEDRPVCERENLPRGLSPRDTRMPIDNGMTVP
jgi:hypothetical protein